MARYKDNGMDHASPPTHSGDFEKKDGPKRVFLSYAWEDAQLANRLASAINKYAGNSLVLSFDAWSAKPGSDLATTITSMVQKSDAMVVVLPNNGIHNWIGAELALGLAKSESDKDFLLIPIRTAGAAVPILLQNRVYLDLAHSDVDTAARQIIDALLSRRTNDLTSSEERGLLVSVQRKAFEVHKAEYERASADSKWLFTVSLLVAVAALLLTITVTIAPNDKLVERLWSLVLPIVTTLLGYAFGRVPRVKSRDAKDSDRKRIRND